MLEELTDEIREFCEARNWTQFHTPKELAIGLSTESNELLQQFRFKSESEQQALLDDPETRSQIEAELADILYFILRFADLYDIDLAAALEAKLQQNREQYPVEEYKSSTEKYNQ